MPGKGPITRSHSGTGAQRHDSSNSNDDQDSNQIILTEDVKAFLTTTVMNEVQALADGLNIKKGKQHGT